MAALRSYPQRRSNRRDVLVLLLWWFSVVALSTMTTTTTRTSTTVLAFSTLPRLDNNRLSLLLLRNAKPEQKGNDVEKDQEDTVFVQNAVTKASWYAAEALGKVVGAWRRPDQDDNDAAARVNVSQPPQSIAETLLRLKQDNTRNYFLSGQVDRLIYDPDCTFADPFVSFEGRDRFVDNLANLGSFVSNYQVRLLQYDEDPTTDNQNDSNDSNNVVRVTTKFMVKLQLDILPWKPILAWPWGVTCEIDPQTNLIVQHTEAWDIEPWEVRGVCALDGPFGEKQSLFLGLSRLYSFAHTHVLSTNRRV